MKNSVKFHKMSYTSFRFTRHSDAHAQCVIELSIAERVQTSLAFEAAGVLSAFRAKEVETAKQLFGVTASPHGVNGLPLNSAHGDSSMSQSDFRMF